MSTNPPQPVAPEVPADVSKALQQASQGMSALYLALANANDDGGGLSEAVIQLQRGLGAISKNIGSAMNQTDAPMPDQSGGMPLDMGAMPPDGGAMPPDMGGMSPGAEMTPEEMGGEGMPPMEGMPPGASIEDAAGATHELMLDAAKRRAQGQ